MSISGHRMVHVKINYSAHVHHNKGTCHNTATVWLIDFNILYGTKAV